MRPGYQAVYRKLDGIVLDILVQNCRNAKAAKRFFRHTALRSVVPAWPVSRCSADVPRSPIGDAK